MANDRKNNKEREINKEKVAIQQYRQSKRTEEEVQAVSQEVNNLKTMQGETNKQIIELTKELKLMREAMRERPTTYQNNTPQCISQSPGSVQAIITPLLYDNEQGKI